jgi:hypothetical protein
MPTGRPPSLDDAKLREIRALVSAGLTLAEAARYVGCSVRTIQRREKHDAQFRRDVSQARLSARLDPEKLMRQAASTHWRAAAWLLERTKPDRYARRSQAACTPEDLDHACRRLIEVALSEIDNPEARRRAFERLSAVADDSLAAVHARRRRPAPITPRTDSEEMAVQMDEIIGAGDKQHASPPAEQPDDGCHTARDKSPVASDKTTAPFDARPHAAAPANAGASAGVERQNARVLSEKTRFEKSDPGRPNPLAAGRQSTDNTPASTAVTAGDRHHAPVPPPRHPTADLAHMLADRIRARSTAKD